ncbi:hypothetical protein [Pantoea ananatis]|uniref:hypothetical protein n=1 Tax=Pantoea ananas TaxID=553 RepID=UPI00235EA162|nr:hypothetical protein [Pantoea ananatis]
MAKKKTYAVHFRGQRGERDASEAFQQEETDIWQRWLKHARDNKKTTVVTCSCLPAETDPVRRRLKVHYSGCTPACRKRHRQRSDRLRTSPVMNR